MATLRISDNVCLDRTEIDYKIIIYDKIPEIGKKIAMYVTASNITTRELDGGYVTT